MSCDLGSFMFWNSIAATHPSRIRYSSGEGLSELRAVPYRLATYPVGLLMVPYRSTNSCHRLRASDRLEGWGWREGSRSSL
ncbi:unnamed protein product [Mycena citricolor]|uniref:Uncharacterized protein n=1 Tax=Mycena citricolor TaxID=2018698 RepID=A0AAD2K5U7_9AGAR|nr:unnamed protein product [Mycena citricolor]